MGHLCVAGSKAAFTLSHILLRLALFIATQERDP
jgi:hypothetical protein